MGNQSSQIPLAITFYETDTHNFELYDYQSRIPPRMQYFLRNKCYLLTDTHDGSLKLVERIHPHQRPDFQIQMYNQDAKEINITRLFYDNIAQSPSSRILWRVIEPEQKYQLKVGDQIKLGKTKFTLKTICKDKKPKTKEKQPLNNQYRSDVSSVSGISRANQCRICFRSTNSVRNPLLTGICKCAGSLNAVHYVCLKDWLKVNRDPKIRGTSLFYSYSQPFCEICKQYYNSQIKAFDQVYNLIETQQIPSPYLVFQSQDQQSVLPRKIKYILSLGQERNALVGRNTSCLFNIRDISVSRAHCLISFYEGKFYIEDQFSKYGTLVQVHDDTEISCLSGVKFQIGSKMIKIDKQENNISCCCESQVKINIKMFKKRIREKSSLYAKSANEQNFRLSNAHYSLENQRNQPSRYNLVAQNDLNQSYHNQSQVSFSYDPRMNPLQGSTTNYIRGSVTLNLNRNITYSQSNLFEAQDVISQNNNSVILSQR